MRRVVLCLFLCATIVASAPVADDKDDRFSESYMNILIARILAQIKAQQTPQVTSPPRGGPIGGGNIGGPPTPTGPFPNPPPSQRLGAPHVPHSHPGIPRHFSESHEHHVNEGKLLPHRHFDYESIESHERYQDAQNRADGKIVPLRPLHPKHQNPHNAHRYPHWSDSHEHHVNEGNQMGDHRHMSRESRESHEFFLRRQAIADNLPAPTPPAINVRPRLFEIPEIRQPVMNYGHRKHGHWYNNRKHFSSSHEHHVNEGNQMKPHRHFSRESLEEHQYFLKQQKAADRGFTVRPQVGRFFNSDESDIY